MNANLKFFFDIDRMIKYAGSLFRLHRHSYHKHYLILWESVFENLF